MVNPAVNGFDPSVILRDFDWGKTRRLAGGRTVREWIRADPQNPAAYRLAQLIYEDMGAHDLAADVAAAGRKARRRLAA